MIEFDKLKLARGLKCAECNLYADLWLQSKEFDRLGILEENKPFNDQLLIDLEAHIKTVHPERYEAFLK
jgi:hypothetical protein